MRPWRVAAADPVARVQPRQHELHARRPHRVALARVHLERLLPRLRHALQPLRVVRARQHVAHLDLHALAEHVRDLVQPVLVHVLLEHDADRVRDDRFQHLPLAHLVRTHQVEFQLAERRRGQVAQVADARHRRLLAEPHAAVPGARDHRPVVRDAEPGAHARSTGRRTSTSGPLTLICSMISFMKYGTNTGNSPPRSSAGLLLHDLDAQRALARVVRLDQRADAVLQLRDHLARAVVRRRVRAEQDQHVEVELDRVAADLHVALFEDVEQPDLDEFVQLRASRSWRRCRGASAGSARSAARPRPTCWCPSRASPGRSRRSRRRTWCPGASRSAYRSSRGHHAIGTCSAGVFATSSFAGPRDRACTGLRERGSRGCRGTERTRRGSGRATA